MTPDCAVRNFRSFLEASWQNVQLVLTDSSQTDSLLDDWLQANWELVVEAVICQTPGMYLEVYGDGADCNGSSSRVWMPDAMPTHRIVCRAKSGSQIVDVLSGTILIADQFEFRQLVSWDGNQYGQSPPFNFVLLEKGDDIALVEFDTIVFKLQEN